MARSEAMTGEWIIGSCQFERRRHDFSRDLGIATNCNSFDLLSRVYFRWCVAQHHRGTPEPPRTPRGAGGRLLHRLHTRRRKCTLLTGAKTGICFARRVSPAPSQPLLGLGTPILPVRKSGSLFVPVLGATQGGCHGGCMTSSSHMRRSAASAAIPRSWAVCP